MTDTELLPTVHKTEGLDLPFLMNDEMAENHAYKNSTLYDITFHSGEGIKYTHFRWIFEFVHNGEMKYCTYLTSNKLSKTSKLGILIESIKGAIPDDLDMNEVKITAKTVGFRIYIEKKGDYPTVTKIEKIIPLSDVGGNSNLNAFKDKVDPHAQPQPTPAKTIGEMANEPANCYYCDEPLPPNPALVTEKTYEGALIKLCPKCKDRL